MNMLKDNNDHTYRVSLGSRYEQWWRYDLFLTVVGYDRRGNMTSYINTRDKSAGEPGIPVRTAAAESGPCSYIETYAYVIPNTFPESEVIRDSPPFEAELTISCDGRHLETSAYEVNQWGGLSIVARRSAKE